MSILFALTYYRPHVSGLTIYVQRLAEALAACGHQVTVLTSRYDRSLPEEEIVGGVRIVRARVIARISKGVIMPTFPALALRLVRQHDVISIHLPQAEAPLLALLGRLAGRPVILTYHCELKLPDGFFNRVAERAVALCDQLAGMLATAIVAYTRDYAEHSGFLSRFSTKGVIIPPPVHMAPPDPAAVRAFEHRQQLDGERRIGFAARLAREKGVEHLLAAIPFIRQDVPRLRVLFAGPYQNVLGEAAYYERLRPLFEQHQERWTFLGPLVEEEMAAFYAACDVTVLPSTNLTESFGLVQVESMLCGTPVVATNLPGVRVPVRTTGMGEIVPIGDARALAAALVKVLQNPAGYRRAREVIAEHFSTDRTVREYLDLFQNCLRTSNASRG